MKRSERQLAAWIGLALCVRLAAIVLLGTWTGGPAAAGAYEHDVIARQLVSGGGFAFPFYALEAGPTATQAPVIPALLALCYAIFGVATPAATLAAQLVMAALCVPGLMGLAWLVGLLGERRLTSDPAESPTRVAAWQQLALAGFALAPAFVYMATRIQSIAWSVCMLLFVLGLFARTAQRPSRRRAIEAGLGVGVACLGEPILALPLGLAWWPLALGGFARPTGEGAPPSARRFAPHVVWVPLVAALCVLPWVARNTGALGAPTFIKSSFWYVFWQGNHVGASGTDKRPVEAATAATLRWRIGGADLESGLEAARRQAVSVDTRLAAEEVEALQALPDERARMAWFGERIRRELAAAPAQYPKMVLRRLAMIAWFDDTNPRSFALPYRLPYLGLAVLSGVGLGFWGRPRGPDWLVVAAALGLVVALGGIITSARFRLLLEALMIVPAAWGMACLWSRLFDPSQSSAERSRSMR